MTRIIYEPLRLGHRKEYGVGRVQLVRREYVKVEFNPSVFMTPPYRSENKVLPLSEVERVDTPLERAARGEWEPAWRFELKMLAARLLTGNKGGQLSNARTEILPLDRVAGSAQAKGEQAAAPGESQVGPDHLRRGPSPERGQLRPRQDAQDRQLQAGRGDSAAGVQRGISLQVVE